MALALFLRLIAIQGPLLMQKAPVALFCRRRAWCSRRKWKGASKVSQGGAIRGFGLFGDTYTWTLQTTLEKWDMAL